MIHAGVRTDSMIGVTIFSISISQVLETVHYFEQQLQHHRSGVTPAATIELFFKLGGSVA